jgi:orotate phosphoribosyltransferase
MSNMEEWWGRLHASGAVWVRPCDSRAPHVVLRSGRHSDGFIDTLRFLSETHNLKLAANALAYELMQDIGGTRIDWVFGSPMAGIPLATVVASMLDAKHVAFTEKKGGDKELISRFDVPPGETVLLIEEMTTTGGTSQRGIDAILAKSPEAVIIPVVGAFLIRCTKNPAELRSARIVPVLDLPALGVVFNEWEPDTCPLCEAGSRAITNCKQVWSDLLRTMQEPDHLVPQT